MISKEKVPEGDLVLVDFATKRCIKYYAGNIATVLRDEDGGDFVCNFLQKKANNQIIWPQQKDQTMIDVSQIKMFLPRPNDLMCGTRYGQAKLCNTLSFSSVISWFDVLKIHFFTQYCDVLFVSRVFRTKKMSKDPLPWGNIGNVNVNVAVQS